MLITSSEAPPSFSPCLQMVEQLLCKFPFHSSPPPYGEPPITPATSTASSSRKTASATSPLSSLSPIPFPKNHGPRSSSASKSKLPNPTSSSFSTNLDSPTTSWRLQRPRNAIKMMSWQSSLFPPRPLLRQSRSPPAPSVRAGSQR